jgi:hypothetical protein
MKRKETMLWIPLYVDKYLFGSTRDELLADEQAIWTDFLCLGAKDEGFIRANVGFPYSEARIAGILGRAEELVHRTIEKCLKTWTSDPDEKPKLTRMPDGTLYITNWPEYQFSDRYVRMILAGERPVPGSANTEQVFQKAAPIGKERKGKEKKDKTYPDDFLEEDVRLTELLIKLMGENNPESSIIKRLTLAGRGRWADVSRKLREIDGQAPAKIEAVIRFSQEDSFWSGNILSMPTLREKWDQLVMKARRGQGDGGHHVSQIGASTKQDHSTEYWAEARRLKAQGLEGQSLTDALAEFGKKKEKPCPTR